MKKAREVEIDVKGWGLERLGRLALIRDARGRLLLRIDVRLFAMGDTTVPLDVDEEEAERLQGALQEAADELADDE